MAQLSRLAVPALVAVLGLSAWACSSGTNYGGGGCSDDTECADDEVCEEGSCVPYQGSGSGAGSGTGSGSTGSGVTPGDQALCSDYLACLASVSPDQVADAIAAYGPDGSCWQGGPDVQATCAQACFESMKGYHDAAPDVCFECYVDADCASSHCAQGACVVDGLPVPTSSPDCSSCADASAGADCADVAAACAANPDCVAFGGCVQGCAGDTGCLQACGDPFASGYVQYLTCVCSVCASPCGAEFWCMGAG